MLDKLWAVVNKLPPMRFSLLTEPWLPLITHGGAYGFVSLRDALLHPAKWRGVGTTNPIQVLSLYRLLLAICHRGIGPGDLEDRAALLDDWPSQQLGAYLEHWAERFDLFHPDYPFLQVPGLAEAGLKPIPWTRLAPDRSSGAERLLWDRSLDHTPKPITPAQAAVALVAHLQFTPGGLVRALRYSGGQGLACGSLLTIPTGNTLQETLALSLVPQNHDDHKSDLASWEKPPPTIEALRKPVATIPTGPADRYTWLSRAVFLPPEDAITHLFYGAGLAPAESPRPDPMAAMVIGKKGAFPLKLREDRAMWRDFYALTGYKGSTPPKTIDTAAAIRDIAQDEDDSVTLLAGGLLPDQAKIVLWRLEERCISPRLLVAQGDAVTVANEALKLAESAGGQLQKALFALCSAWLQNGGERSPATADVKDLLNSTQVMAYYWATLEPSFWGLVYDLGQGEDGGRVLATWKDILRRVVLQVRDRARDALGSDGRALAAAGRAGKALGKVFKFIKEVTA